METPESAGPPTTSRGTLDADTDTSSLYYDGPSADAYTNDSGGTVYSDQSTNQNQGFFGDTTSWMGNQFQDFQRTTRNSAANFYDEVNRGYSAAAAFGDTAVGSADEAVGRASDAYRRGDYRQAGRELTPAGTGQYAGNIASGFNRGGVAGGLDTAAGQTDEAAHDYAGGLDVLAGSTDEAVGRAVEAGRRGDIVGVYDNLYGGTDEAVGRSISAARQGDWRGAADNIAGGLDNAAVGAGETLYDWQTTQYRAWGNAGQGAIDAAGQRFDAVGSELRQGDVAGAGDALAGGMDESVGRMSRYTADRYRSSEEFLRETSGAINRGDYGGAANLVGQELTHEYDYLAAMGDELAGSTDEYVGSAELNPGERQLDAPSNELKNPFRRGEMDSLSDEQIRKQVAEENSGVDPDDVTVTRGERGTSFTVNLDSQDVRERVANQYDDVSADDVAISQNDQGELEYHQQGTGVVGSATTSGGFLSESDEAVLKDASQNFQEDLGVVADLIRYSPTARFEQGSIAAYEEYTGRDAANVGIGGVTLEKNGMGITERFGRGAITGVGSVGNVFMWGSVGETATEIAGNAPSAAREYGTAAVGTAAVAGVREMGEALVGDFAKNPVRSLGSLAGEFVIGAGAGKLAGSVGRAARGRVRTLGSGYIEAEVQTNRGTVGYYEGRNSNPANRFPGAKDPDLYRTDPARAVSEQADRYTDERVGDFFQEQGYSEGTTLKKAIEVEPEGPSNNRGPGQSTGFETQEGDYESPGAFAGPELSPNFLGIESDYGARFSLRPGLPDFGGSPTGVLVRTDVEAPDATNMDEFRQEMLDRSGETTARTKPAGSSELNVGEIEAVIPPEARFERVGGRLRGLAERFGIGSQFHTKIGGRRVPFRPVAPEGRGGPDAPDSPVNVDVPQSGSGSGNTLDYYAQAPEQVVDRPLPVFGAGGGGGAVSQSQTGQPQQGQPSDPFGSIEQDIQDLFGGGRITSGDRSRTTRPESQGDGEYVDPDYTGGDKDLPGDWRRVSREELARRNRERRREARGSDSRDRDYRDRGRDGGSYTEYGDSDSSSRVTDSDRRVTGGGSSSRPPGGSEPTSPPPYEPPRFPPYSTYGPPSYGVPTSPGGPAEYVDESSTGGVPYNPVLQYPNWRNSRDLDDEEEQRPKEIAMPFGYFGHGWVNPVADAQQAAAAVLGGGGDYGLGAVQEDLQSLR